MLAFLVSAIRLGMTFLLGSTGETITEKSGHLNLGIPGIMCMGGAGGCVALQMMVNTGWHPVGIVTLAILASFATGMPVQRATMAAISSSVSLKVGMTGTRTTI